MLGEKKNRVPLESKSVLHGLFMFLQTASVLNRAVWKSQEDFLDGISASGTTSLLRIGNISSQNLCWCSRDGPAVLHSGYALSLFMSSSTHATCTFWEKCCPGAWARLSAEMLPLIRPSAIVRKVVRMMRADLSKAESCRLSRSHCSSSSDVKARKARVPLNKHLRSL